MSQWLSLLKKPENLGETETIDSWFFRIASQLLNGSHLVVGNQPHRLTEIEFYYFGDVHLDPFTHCDRLQLEFGRWYFHRSRGTYRGGSFKGLDFTFGDSKAFGGVLIRSIKTADNTIIDGPSLCVDYLLAKTGFNDVNSLDKAIDSRVIWDRESPLFLQETDAIEQSQIWRSARVGLSLKKAKADAEMPQYIMLPYRYLTEPRQISKGKPYLVLALYAQEIDLATIQQLTGSTKQSIQRYIADFEAGRLETDFKPYCGVDLNPKQLCKLHGTWYCNFA